MLAVVVSDGRSRSGKLLEDLRDELPTYSTVRRHDNMNATAVRCVQVAQVETSGDALVAATVLPLLHRAHVAQLNEETDLFVGHTKVHTNHSIPRLSLLLQNRTEGDAGPTTGALTLDRARRIAQQPRRRAHRLVRNAVLHKLTTLWVALKNQLALPEIRGVVDVVEFVEPERVAYADRLHVNEGGPEAQAVTGEQTAKVEDRAARIHGHVRLEVKTQRVHRDEQLVAAVEIQFQLHHVVQAGPRLGVKNVGILAVLPEEIAEHEATAKHVVVRQLDDSVQRDELLVRGWNASVASCLGSRPFAHVHA